MRRQELSTLSEPAIAGAVVPAARPVTAEDRPQPPAPGDAPAPSRRGRALLAHPGILSVAVFLIGFPAAFALPRVLPYGGGMGMRSASLPLAVAVIGGAAVMALALWRRPAWLPGVIAGLMGTWFVLILSTALRGTPFPVLGLLGDAGRLTAMATRYSVTAASADPWFRGVPSDYPPLFPWLVGRVSALLDIPAWRLVGDAEVAFMGASVVVGFVLWLRLVNPWTALAAASAGFLSFASVDKAYEVIALAALIPWVVGTFGDPPRGRLHWLPAGLVGAFIFLSYYGWLVLGGIGIVAIAVMTWRRSVDRRAYLLHLGRVLAVILVLTSWFTVPYIYARLSLGGATTGDLYGNSAFLELMFPFLELTWLGLLQLAGLAGLVWLRGRVWWAWPLLALAAGAFAFRLAGVVSLVLTNHTLVAHYTSRLCASLLASAGVLTVLHAVPIVIRKAGAARPRHGAAIAMAVALAWGGYSFTMAWMPGLGGQYAYYTEGAYREPLPDGTYVAGFDHPTPWFPIAAIEREVEKVLGPDPRPVTVSMDERLYAYLPWFGYIGASSASNSAVPVFDRLAELEKLAKVTDPAAFARSSRHTRFGEIDVFILKREDAQTLTWTFHRGYGQKPAVLSFSPAQFGPDDWTVVDLPENVVLAVRTDRSGSSEGGEGT